MQDRSSILSQGNRKRKPTKRPLISSQYLRRGCHVGDVGKGQGCAHCSGVNSLRTNIGFYVVLLYYHIMLSNMLILIKSRILLYFVQNRLHLTIICVATNISTNHWSIWCSPRPGHRPRLDPKKLRETMKLNWSKEVFLTLTSLSKLKLTRLMLPSSIGIVVVIFFLTVAVVRRQGSRQSDTRIP